MLSSADPQRRILDARVLAWMQEATQQKIWEPDEARFNALSLECFRFQFEHCLPYSNYCRALEKTPDTVSHWKEIPAVATDSFKTLVLTSFPPERTIHTFRTSGTTATQRGELHLDTLELYEASLLPTFTRHLFPDIDPKKCNAFFLAAASPEAPDSSLSHMFSTAAQKLGFAKARFFLRNGKLESGDLLVALEASTAQQTPVALFGTAFSFVHFLDELRERKLRLTLPAGSRIMETGGFKGRARECSAEELYALLATHLGVAPARIVNQYGMTELGSQFYDSNLLFPEQPRRKLGPPWARVWCVDPETGREVSDGKVGLIRIFDLANTGSIAALQTADLGQKMTHGLDGFRVLGRQTGAEARGCSIAADTLLSEKARERR